MKALSTVFRWSPLLGVLIVLGGNGPVRAEVPTPPVAPAAPTAPAPEKHDNKVVIHLGDDEESDPRSRLSPEQIYNLELEKAHRPSDKLTEFGVPVAMFTTLTAVVAMMLYMSYRKDRQRHETLRFMVERGTQIPVELIQPPVRKPNDLRRGMLLVATGLGLALFLGIVAEPKMGSAGIVPALIGMGYIAAWKLESKS